MTAAGKIPTAQLVKGTRVLVTLSPSQALPQRWLPAYRKTGATVATVDRLEAYHEDGGHRAKRRYTVHTDVGTVDCAPAQTFFLAKEG